MLLIEIIAPLYTEIELSIICIKVFIKTIKLKQEYTLNEIDKEI